MPLNKRRRMSQMEVKSIQLEEIMDNHEGTSEQTKDTMFIMFVVDEYTTIYITTLMVANL